MIAWVMYDIENDKARSKVAKYCKQAGLYKVQLSVFVGTINKNDKDTLELKIEATINPIVDKVYIFPMTEQNLHQTTLLGQAFDKKLVNDKIKALFF